MLKTSRAGDVCAITTAKSRPRVDKGGRGWDGTALSRDRQTRYELASHSVFERRPSRTCCGAVNGPRQEDVSKQRLRAIPQTCALGGNRWQPKQNSGVHSPPWLRQ